jgi:hypothetical protein
MRIMLGMNTDDELTEESVREVVFSLYHYLVLGKAEIELHGDHGYVVNDTDNVVAIIDTERL